jgi:hypothetical protein
MSYLITGACGCGIGVVGMVAIGALLAAGRRDGQSR